MEQLLKGTIMRIRYAALAAAIIGGANMGIAGVADPKDIQKWSLDAQRHTTHHIGDLFARADHAPPPSGFNGRYFTTPDDCTYAKTQAPGYAPMWILILNPYHVGRPNAHRNCPGTL